MHYRINLPTMVLAYRDNHHAAVTLPEAAVIEALGPDVDDRFVIVKRCDEQFLVFESDLRDRAEPLPKHKEKEHGTHGTFSTAA